MTAQQSMTMHMQREYVEIPEQSTLPYAEMISVCTELQRLYDEMELTENEMFISTAENEGLDEYTMLFGTDGSAGIQEKRIRTIALLSICEENGCNFLKEHLGEPFGITGTLTEENGTVYFDTNESLSQELQQHIQFNMQKLMPVNTNFSLRTV